MQTPGDRSNGHHRHGVSWALGTWRRCTPYIEEETAAQRGPLVGDSRIHSVHLPPVHSPHWLLDAPQTPRMPLPQGLCTWLFLPPGLLFPTHLNGSLSYSFNSFLKYPSFRLPWPAYSSRVSGFIPFSYFIFSAQHLPPCTL